jgi:ferric-dicitrate binding protein FerR (iron transport regulator)
MASKEVDRQLLLNYLDGKCTRDQLRQIREYLHDEAYRDSLDLFMQEEWAMLESRPFPPLPDMEDQYKKFRSAYTAPETTTPAPESKTPVRKIRIIRRTAAIAAALVLAAVGMWHLLPRLAGRQTPNVATQWMSWHNEPGHHSEITLPDSTKVYLAPAATLRYAQNDGQARLVQLEGEAYFVVRRDQHRPFTVVSGDLSIRDIGTEFNIRYYPGEPSIAIAVASGKVKVLWTNTPATALLPGQLLQYDSLTKRSAITDLPDPSAIGAWRKGILTFHRQSLKAVTDELQRFYGLPFHYTDPASQNLLITTQLDNKSLGDALDILALTAGVHFTREPNLILIK